MTAQKTLQKLTEVDRILEKEKITREDVKNLSKGEIAVMQERMSERINSLNDGALDKYIEKIEAICGGKDELRNQQWEKNHIAIVAAISNLLYKLNRLPNKNEIAAETGLSRQTIAAHLKGFDQSDIYQEEKRKFKILSDRLLTKVYQYACSGNTKAARLYFEMTGDVGKRSTNNYFIQINNLRVDEQLIRSLPPEALKTIEDIICQYVAPVQAPKPINSDSFKHLAGK